MVDCVRWERHRSGTESAELSGHEPSQGDLRFLIQAIGPRACDLQHLVEDNKEWIPPLHNCSGQLSSCVGVHSALPVPRIVERRALSGR